MGEIYRRDSLIPKSDKPKTINRKRNIIMNFRVNEEEQQLINDRIQLSGMMRQEFFIESCLHQKITTFGNVKTFNEIKVRMKDIEEHLQLINKTDELDINIVESLRTILGILNGLEREDKDE